ncbi:hypothetical protein B0J14DRAFT_114874 [Halenospora varia]|nr:hypothetical protein B0J14DRAFT_114874 [Halenospora varia]
MCFYDQYQMACNHYKWGNFRQHCTKEHRIGETCGTKLVMKTIARTEKCKLCSSIDAKQSRVRKEEIRIRRYIKEEQRGLVRGASIEAAQTSIYNLQTEINMINYERSKQSANGFQVGKFPPATKVAIPGAIQDNHAGVGPSVESVKKALVGKAPDDCLNDQINTWKIASSKDCDHVSQSSNAVANSHFTTDMPSHKSTTAAETVLHSFEMAMQEAIVKEPKAKLEDLEYEKAVSISWACRCGSQFQETVIEFALGAAQKLVQAAIDVDIESMAGSPPASSSSSSVSSSATECAGNLAPMKLSGRTQNKSTNANEASHETSAGMNENQSEAQYILLCKSKGNEIVLKHADISKALCDQSSYHVLHRKHYGRLSRMLRWVTLKEIESVEFVKVTSQ